MKNLIKLLKEKYEQKKQGKNQKDINYSKAYSSKNIVISGDFNFHVPLETISIYEENYSDVYLEHNPFFNEDTDYTWDPV